MTKMNQVSQTLAEVTDPGFRARCVNEYERVVKYTGDICNIETASILDFGCGQGIAACSFALRNPKASVDACDIFDVDTSSLSKLYNERTGLSLPVNLSFRSINGIPTTRQFDLIYAWSVFEHVARKDYADVTKWLFDRLSPNGILFVQVNPLYYSERGSHLYRYFKEPWHHLTLSIDELQKEVLSFADGDVASREWKQFMELNRMTADEMISLIDRRLKCKRKQFFTNEKLLPPQNLLSIYQNEVLTTYEFIAVFTK